MCSRNPQQDTVLHAVVPSLPFRYDRGVLVAQPPHTPGAAAPFVLHGPEPCFPYL